MRRPERLTSGAEFQALFQQGKRVERPAMVVLWRSSEKPRRAGFTVARQIRGSVLRNRARRRLREAYRRARHEAPAEVDLIVIGRPKALAAAMDSLIEDMCAAFRSIGHTREKK